MGENRRAPSAGQLNFRLPHGFRRRNGKARRETTRSGTPRRSQNCVQNPGPANHERFPVRESVGFPTIALEIENRDLENENLTT
jgi:hypothetical protein